MSFLLKLLITKDITSKSLSTPFFFPDSETEVVGTGLQKITGPSSEQAIILSGFRLYKLRSPSLTTQIRRKKKFIRKLSEKWFGSFPRTAQGEQEVHPILQTAHCQPIAPGSRQRSRLASAPEWPAARGCPGATSVVHSPAAQSGS